MTKAALADGTVSTAHASVIAHATSRLPESLTDAERAKVETALVRQARQVDPARLRRAARRALLAAQRTAAEADAHEDAQLRSEEARAEARVRLTMHDNRDGTVTGHFTVPTLAGSILRKTIQQMTAPRRRGPGGGTDRGASREAHRAGHGRSGQRPSCARPARGPADCGGQRLGRRRDARRWPGRRLGAPVRAGVRRAARAPRHRPAQRQGRRHRRGHHRPREAATEPGSSPPRHRARPVRQRGTPVGLLGRVAARGPRRHLAPARPRPHQPVLQRGATRRPGHDLRRVLSHRLRPALRLVRAPPPGPLGHRRCHRPAPRRAAMPLPPPTSPRPPLRPPHHHRHPRPQDPALHRRN